MGLGPAGKGRQGKAKRQGKLTLRNSWQSFYLMAYVWPCSETLRSGGTVNIYVWCVCVSRCMWGGVWKAAKRSMLVVLIWRQITYNFATWDAVSLVGIRDAWSLLMALRESLWIRSGVWGVNTCKHTDPCWYLYNSLICRCLGSQTKAQYVSCQKDAF